MPESLKEIPVPSPESSEDFISTYLEYTAQTECPTFFHRWTAISCLAAWIGRDIYFPFGHQKLHVNMYIMFVAEAGTKKSTAIKIGAKLLKQAGYTDFAAKKTRQEKFLIDMAEASGIVGGKVSSKASAKAKESMSEEDILDMNLFSTTDSRDLSIAEVESMAPSEVFIPADEINNFIGSGNLDFMSILGELWDIDECYEYKLKNSDSVTIAYPTINLLGGNTFAGFNKLFPPEAMDQGFFSRMLFIYAEPTGIKLTVPPDPSEEIKAKLIEHLNEIKKKVRGKISITKQAYRSLDHIYKNWAGMEDIRFNSYENRRIIHLIKLAILFAANRVSTKIEEEDIIYANTVLSFTEQLMPKALGEFGKAKNSDVTHRIMTAIYKTRMPITQQEIWKVVVSDLENRTQMAEILNNLLYAKKIFAVEGGGYLPIKKPIEDGAEGMMNWELLTNQERGLVK